MAKFIGYTVLWAATLFGGILLKGWVLTLLWGWFAAPTFDLPRLALGPAMGVSLLATFLTHQMVDAEPKKRTQAELLAYTISGAVFRPLFFLAMGAAIHSFMGAA